MADKDKKKSGEKETEKGKSSFSVRFAFFMLFVTAVVFLPTTILFSICLIPTLVAAIIDNQPQKTIWLTVGAMNMAGTVPNWFTLWDMGHTIPAAFQLIAQPMTIILSYGGAAAGWLIHLNVTPLVAKMILARNEARLREIDRIQKNLVKKWGDEVAAK